MANGGVMSLLSRLFGRDVETSSVRIEDFGLGGDFVTVQPIDFFGQRSRSPSGRFSLVWRDSNDAGTHGGARTSGSGSYILVDGDRVCCAGKIERPNDGKVADNGTFIFNDWRFNSQELRGTFCAFRPDGTEILSVPFKANLYNNGMSRDGRHAVCQTANSGDESDGNILTMFDLADGRELARWRPESGWANSYEFSEDGAHILLVNPQRPKLAYTLEGLFVDRQAWIDDALARGDVHVIARVFDEAGEHSSAQLIKRLIAGVDVGLRVARVDDYNTKAFMLRLKGRCLDTLGELSAALECFDTALGLNPKVGAKRRAEQIRKMLARTAR